MTEVRSPKVVETDYGPKLEFEVPQHKQRTIEPQLRSTEWNDVHYEIPEQGSRWRIDLSFSVFDTVESETDLQLPRDYLIEDASDAIFKIHPEELHIRIVKCPMALLEELKRELSYEVEWYDQRSNEKKTNKKDLIDDGKIPIGLEKHVRDVVNDLPMNATFIDRRDPPERGQVSYDWNFPYDLRPYQRNGLKRCLEGPCVVQWPTGAGKTVLALNLIHELGLKTLVLVNRKELLHQWCDEVREILGVEPGVIQGDREEYRNVTIAMIQSLHNRVEDRDEYWIDEFDNFITDECHHVPAQTWFDVAMSVNAYYRYGLSATAEANLRNDEKGLKVIGGIGPNDIRLDPEGLIDKGYLASPDFQWIYPGGPGNKPFDEWQQAYNECIVQNGDRNRKIALKAQEELEEGRRVLVDVNRIEHGERLLRLFPGGLMRDWWDPLETPRGELRYDVDFDVSGCERPIPIVHDGFTVRAYDEDGSMLDALKQAIAVTEDPVLWVTGEDSDEVRDYALELFGNGLVTGMVSTLLGEGVNIPEMNTVILASGGKSSIQLIQTIGRVLRPSGDRARIIDCVDHGEYVREHFRERVKTMSNYYGHHFNNPPDGYTPPSYEE